MPYLILWDKISQNLAHLEASSHKIFQISQNFQIILQNILWRNKHTSLFVVFTTSFLHLDKGFWLFWGSWGSSKLIFVKISQNIIKSPLKICHISQISLHSLWHACAADPDCSYVKFINFLHPSFKVFQLTYCRRQSILLKGRMFISRRQSTLLKGKMFISRRQSTLLKGRMFISVTHVFFMTVVDYNLWIGAT